MNRNFQESFLTRTDVTRKPSLALDCNIANMSLTLRKIANVPAMSNKIANVSVMRHNVARDCPCVGGVDNANNVPKTLTLPISVPGDPTFLGRMYSYV